MFPDYKPLHFELEGRPLKGFCMRIADQFYETYAVILDGYQSFSIWRDEAGQCWHASKSAAVDYAILDKVFSQVSAG